MDDELKKTDLPRGTRVHVSGKWTGKIRWRFLDPNRKPGITRVSYSVEPCLRHKDGTETYGIFMCKTVAARLCRVLEPLP